MRHVGERLKAGECFNLLIMAMLSLGVGNVGFTTAFMVLQLIQLDPSK